MAKYYNYDGRDLPGLTLITYKIDGVHAIKTKDGIVSRHGKPLYNVPDFEGEVEVFLGNFKDSIVATRTKSYKEIRPEHLYDLSPCIDKRLVVCRQSCMDSDDVATELAIALKLGYEGLVLYNNAKMYKVKPVVTYDTKILDVVEGTGKYKNMLGAFITPLGKVGTGFTDEMRYAYYDKRYIGQMIEVKGMELLPSGKLRHPVFVRRREDK